MNTEMTNQLETISAEISQEELESIATSLPVKSNVRAGAVKNCCGRNCCS